VGDVIVTMGVGDRFMIVLLPALSGRVSVHISSYMSVLCLRGVWCRSLYPDPSRATTQW
jgi:hypothetical protein